MTHAERHRRVVEMLAAAVKPVRPLWPVRARLALWLLLEAMVLVWVGTHTGNDFMRKLGNPEYALEVALFAIAAALAAAMALCAAIPGRSLSFRELVVAIMLVIIGTVLVMIGARMRVGYPLGDFLHAGLGCAVETCVLGVLPWIALWWAVKRGAPTGGAAAGGLIGAAAMLFSFALMRLNCRIDEPLHVITWHLLPALTLIALSAIAGALWLRFRPGARLS
jgi:hypothetical protein